MEKGKVLLVEDNHILAETYANIIKSKGFEVITAEDGQQAIQKFDQLKNVVIVTDLMMPNVNGLELLKTIKGKQPSTQVIIITGKKMDKAKYSDVIKYHAFDFLEKPIEGDAIIDAISRAFEESERVKREIKAKLEAQREMLSFLSHTLRSSIGGAHTTVERVLRKAKVLLEDKKQEKDAQLVLNNISKLDSIFLSMSSTLDVYSLLVNTPEQLATKWKNDIAEKDGSITIDYILAYVLKQVFARLLFERPFLSQLKRLIKSVPASLTSLRNDFMEQILLENFSDKEHQHVLNWVEEHFPVIKVNLSPTEALLNYNGMRFNILFACIYEMVFNAIKYTNNQSPVELNLEVQESAYILTCQNYYDQESIGQMGTGKGLSFIKELIKNLEEIDVSSAKDEGQYIAQLKLTNL